MNIYRLNTELSTLLSSLSEDGELTTAQLAACESLTGEIPIAVDQLCRMIRQAGAIATLHKSEANWFMQRARQQAGIEQTCKTYLYNLLDIASINQIQTAGFRVSLSMSPPSVKVDDSFEPASLIGVADDLIETKTHLLSSKVHDRYKAGVGLPDGVSIVTTNRHVRIAPL